ncbi:hypothetical protein Q3H58_002380 [Pseudomonas psychrotolerans]|nr:hypothetical protein [Pseudomonas psychrotolerans]
MMPSEGAFHHRGQVGLVLLVLAAALAGGEHGEGQAGGQQAEQLAEQVHQGHRDQVLRRDEGRGGGECQLPLPAVDALRQPALGQLPGALLVLAMPIEQTRGVGDGHVAQADDQPRNVQPQTAEHFLDAQGYIGPPQGSGLPCARIGRRKPLFIDRQHHQETGLGGRRGLQLQRTGQMDIGMLHGQHGGLAADGIGRRVHADGLEVTRDRLQVLDDIAIAVMGSEGTNGEIGPAIGAGFPQKAGFVGLGHPADEADAPRAAKFLAQVMDAAVVTEQLTRQVATGDHHQVTHADQAVFIGA